MTEEEKQEKSGRAGGTGAIRAALGIASGTAHVPGGRRRKTNEREAARPFGAARAARKGNVLDKTCRSEKERKQERPRRGDRKERGREGPLSKNQEVSLSTSLSFPHHSSHQLHSIHQVSHLRSYSFISLQLLAADALGNVHFCPLVCLSDSMTD